MAGMMDNRGPVLFATAYSACIVSTIVAVVLNEKYADIDFRSWAPFLQAFLSAGAIGAAWFLQERKRAAERRDAEDSLRLYFRVYSGTLEHWAAWFDERAGASAVTHSLLKRNVKHFNEEVDALRRVPVQNIRDRRALASVHLFTVACRQFGTVVEEAEEAAANGSKIAPDAFRYRLKQIIRRRTDMLIAFGEKATTDRLSAFPEAAALVRERVEGDIYKEQATAATTADQGRHHAASA